MTALLAVGVILSCAGTVTLRPGTPAGALLLSGLGLIALAFQLGLCLGLVLTVTSVSKQIHEERRRARVLRGRALACPECGRSWARVYRGQKLIARKMAYKTVTRLDYHESADGEHRGTTGRSEQVKVLRKTFRLRYECRYCGHRWEEIEEEDDEDFEID
jgi:hypothetical protein